MTTRTKPNGIIGADVAMADELVLCIVNDGKVYDQICYARRNLVRKVKRGIYDPVLAGRAWRYTVENYLADWKRENGYTGRIDVPTRNLAGRFLEENQREYVYQEAGVSEPQFPVQDAELRAIEAEVK